jgi:hypothetical protein
VTDFWRQILIFWRQKAFLALATGAKIKYWRQKAIWRHFYWRQSRFWRRVLAVDFYDPKKFGAKSESGAKNR